MNKYTLLILVLSATLASCVSSPDGEKKPDLVINAEKFLSQGVVRYNAYNYKLARFNFEKALHSFKSIDNPDGIISSHINLARCALAIGNITSAEQHLAKARKLLNETENKIFVPHIDLIDANIALENGNLVLSEKLVGPYINNSTDKASYRAALLIRIRIALLKDSDDKSDWIKQYENIIETKDKSTDHARLLRFKVEIHKQPNLLNEALSIYRKHAHQPGIAATLTEWADIDSRANNHEAAIDKLKRALYIRQDLKDLNNCFKILTALSSEQSKSNSKGEELTNLWIKKISTNKFKDWDKFTAAFNGDN